MIQSYFQETSRRGKPTLAPTPTISFHLPPLRLDSTALAPRRHQVAPLLRIETACRRSSQPATRTHHSCKHTSAPPPPAAASNRPKPGAPRLCSLARENPFRGQVLAGGGGHLRVKRPTVFPPCRRQKPRPIRYGLPPPASTRPLHWPTSAAAAFPPPPPVSATDLLPVTVPPKMTLHPTRGGPSARLPWIFHRRPPFRPPIGRNHRSGV